MTGRTHPIMLAAGTLMTLRQDIPNIKVSPSKVESGSSAAELEGHVEYE